MAKSEKAEKKKPLVPETPLLVGQTTETPLDLITKRLFFLIPLTSEQIKWLNTTIYRDSLLWINYWSLTHTLWGMIWGVLWLIWPKIFTIGRFVLWHTFFEIWELWAGGYFTGQTPFIYAEWVDVLLDTLFGVAGLLLVALLAYGGPKSPFLK